MTIDLSSPSQTIRTTKETHPDLPPGLIIGPDGRPCKVCNSWQDWAKIKVKKKGNDQPETQSGTRKEEAGPAAGMERLAGMVSGVSTASSAYKEPASQVSQIDRSNCPPDTVELGRSTWTFLHTTAAYYPVVAPSKTQSNMLNLLSSLSLLYPCSWCATDFQKDMQRHPPDVSGREGLMKWLCERHNEVNQKLGKERFSCNVLNLDARWKDGPENGSCD
ncbi:uncharacterized protein L203_100226 [Cryptococcus depauperatus CBS 7841]|uniref:Sulfhydryl oxidase n=1 Tax=Cryptococcus depauperatus CBS 7841 TaxID=1295531 RepID=A0A1E3J1D2_9TREE|nr:mitochondrial FAD-linked sulfhydryl oxidase ERV1 [Cryptococcus depauperatus CBS 7841]